MQPQTVNKNATGTPHSNGCPHSVVQDLGRSRLLSKYSYQKKNLRHLYSWETSFEKYHCPATTNSVLSHVNSESLSCCHCSPCLQEAVHQQAGGFSLNSFKVVHSFPRRKCCIMSPTAPFCLRNTVNTHRLHHSPKKATVVKSCCAKLLCCEKLCASCCERPCLLYSMKYAWYDMCPRVT